MARTKNTKPGKRKGSGTPGSFEESWLTQQETAPRADVPDADKMARKARWYRRWVAASVVLLPLSLFGNLAAIGNSAGNNTGPAVAATDPFVATRPVATVAVRRWLAQSPSPLPGASIVGWDSATIQQVNPTADDTFAPYQVQTHYFTLVTGEGITYTTSIQIADDSTHGPVVLTAPSLVPTKPSDTSWSVSSYPNNGSYDVTDVVTSAVSVWAQAYTSGDAEKLRTAVLDPNAANAYVPLYGASFNLDDLDIDGVWYSPLNTGTADAPDYVFAQVSLPIVWSFDPPVDDEEPPLVTYTVLIADAALGSAHVVAWGGPGTGNQLKPYMNATSLELIDPETDTPSGAGTDGPLATDEPTVAPSDANGSSPSSSGSNSKSSSSPSGKSPSSNSKAGKSGSGSSKKG